MKMDTNFSSDSRLVLQIIPNEIAGEILINGQNAQRVAVIVFLPRPNGTKLWCPMNYFQDNCSLTEKWIYDDTKNKMDLDGISNLSEVVVTIKTTNNETEINIPDQIRCRLLDYFKLDIGRNLSTFEGFDCHALVCFLTDLKCTPENPNFDFLKNEPEVGQVVALCTDSGFPESIKHWAVCLGSNYYLSKFGESTGKTDAHVTVMNIEGMHKLYKTVTMYVAKPKPDSAK